MRWYLAAEWAPSAPMSKSKSISISGARFGSFSPEVELEESWSKAGPYRSNQALFFLKSAPVSLWLKKKLTFGMASKASSSFVLRPARSTAWID